MHTYNYGYNALGQRISSSYVYTQGTGSSSTIAMGTLTGYSKAFRYDQSGRLIYEGRSNQYYGESGDSESILYLYDETGIIGMVLEGSAAAGTYYFQRNLLGDVVGIYNTSGTKVGGYAYDAWGNCTITLNTNGIAVKNPIRYRGYYYDEDTKLYYLNARYYSPEWRRFISPDDTAYLDPESVNGLNLYAYCYNDPVNYKDPSGRSVTAAILIGSFVVGAVTGLAMSVTTQWIEHGFDLAKINPWLVLSDTIFGGLSGLLAASGFGVLTSAFLGASLSVLQTATSAVIREEELQMSDLIIAAAFGFAGGFITGAGINATQVASKGKTISYHINNAISKRRRDMYISKGKDLLIDVTKRMCNYMGTTIVSSIGSNYVANYIGVYYA